MLDLSVIKQSCLLANVPLQTCQHVDTIDSTNRAMSAFILMADTLPGWHFLMADQQTQGRGQRGKSWISPPNGNWYFSLGHLCAAGEDGIDVDAVQIGQVCLQVLELLGTGPLTLKAPNDILYKQRKLAGILIEHYWQAARCYASVIGIGVNVCKHPQMQEIDQPWITLEEIMPHHHLDTTKWMTSLLIAFMQACSAKT